jgi:hypothetical protein
MTTLRKLPTSKPMIPARAENKMGVVESILSCCICVFLRVEVLVRRFLQLNPTVFYSGLKKIV